MARQRPGTELHYVAGTEFAANNVAVYSPDRPHVVVHGRPQISPWIDMNDLRKRGVLVLWEDGLTAAHVDEWRKRFGSKASPSSSNSRGRPRAARAMPQCRIATGWFRPRH